MERAELLELMSSGGLSLLDSLAPFDGAPDVVAEVARLRSAGHAASLVAAVLTQARLRRAAREKFGEFAARMLFTQAGLEQATRLRVAALHAGRFRDAGLARIGDLGCGIGGDALAMAAVDLDVLAVDSDEVTAAIAAFNLAPFPSARVEVARAQDVALADLDAVYLDPARRTAGHDGTRRLHDPDAFSPPLDVALAMAERMPAGIKLGPGFDRSAIPVDAEAQWVSVDGQVVELALWFGAVARPGIRRAALLLGATGPAELVGGSDAEDADFGPLGEYLFEPDGAVIRARLIGDVARRIGGRMLHPSIAWITADRPADTAFAAGFRVLERLPVRERELKRALRERGIGVLEIKKRGVDVDPAALRTRLGLRGDAAATLILTRSGPDRVALLAERLTAPTDSRVHPEM